MAGPPTVGYPGARVDREASMAPRNTAGSMGGVDIGELFKPFANMAPDWTKAMQGFAGQGLGGAGFGGQKVWQDMLQSHQRNIESVTKLNNAVVDALENHSAMADQALRHEKVFKGLAHLLVDEVYRQLRDKAESAEAQQT